MSYLCSGTYFSYYHNEEPMLSDVIGPTTRKFINYCPPTPPRKSMVSIFEKKNNASDLTGENPVIFVKGYKPSSAKVRFGALDMPSFLRNNDITNDGLKIEDLLDKETLRKIDNTVERKYSNTYNRYSNVSTSYEGENQSATILHTRSLYESLVGKNVYRSKYGESKKPVNNKSNVKQVSKLYENNSSEAFERSMAKKLSEINGNNSSAIVLNVNVIGSCSRLGGENSDFALNNRTLEDPPTADSSMIKKNNGSSGTSIIELE